MCIQCTPLIYCGNLFSSHTRTVMAGLAGAFIASQCVHLKPTGDTGGRSRLQRIAGISLRVYEVCPLQLISVSDNFKFSSSDIGLLTKAVIFIVRAIVERATLNVKYSYIYIYKTADKESLLNVVDSSQRHDKSL